MSSPLHYECPSEKCTAGVNEYCFPNMEQCHYSRLILHEENIYPLVGPSSVLCDEKGVLWHIVGSAGWEVVSP